MQVIVVDPAREITRRAETLFGPGGPELVSVSSFRPLAALLAAATPDDALIARIARDDGAVTLAESVRNSRFPGTTYLVVDRSVQNGLEQRLRLARAESLEFSTPLVDALLRRLCASATMPARSSVPPLRLAPRFPAEPAADDQYAHDHPRGQNTGRWGRRTEHPDGRSRRPRREPAVRPRPRRVHGRHRAPRRRVLAGRQRHAVHRRAL